MKTGGLLTFMIHLPYHLNLTVTFHHLHQGVEELHETFLLIFHLVQEVDLGGVVGVEGDVVGVVGKAEIVSS